jgi:membrane-associated HD superfamily phosphohydrolase
MTAGKIKELETKASEVLPTVMPIGEYPSLSAYTVHAGYEFKVSLNGSYGDWFKAKAYYGSAELIKTEAALIERKQALLDKLEQCKQDCIKVEQDSAEAIANNQAIHQKVKLIMQHIGINGTYRERDTKSRSTYPKYNTVAAGYLFDLTRDIPTAVKGGKPDFERTKYYIEQEFNKVLSQVRKTEQEENAKKALVQKQHQIALLRAKYTPDDAMSSAWLIRENILKQDKYLALAYYLEKNRNDWSDGYSYAEAGLNMFSVETEEDQLIVHEIESLIEDWDDDGRCFRDCAYNYGVLYGMVKNEQLLKDIEHLKDVD